MAEKKSWVMYKTWIPLFTSLPTEKAGELIKAICAYENGWDVALSDPIISSVFVMIKNTLEKDAEEYEKVCQKRAESASKANASKSKQKRANATKRKQKDATEGDNDNDNENDNDHENDNENDKDSKPKRTQAALVGESDLSEPVKDKLMEWLAYKKERKDSYGERGLQSLISQVHRHEQESGSSAVINVIDLSMSNQWKGIIWEKIEPTARSGTTQSSEVMGWLTA